jgi:hypothetical protein
MHPEHLCDRLGDGQTVGIVVARTSRNNMHSGIAYKWRGKDFIYHQRWHGITRCEDFDKAVIELGGTTMVVAMQIRRDRQMAIAGFLDNLNKKNPLFPYSLKYDPKARIDTNIGVLFTNGIGLSCVTFVLAVFLSVTRMRFLDISSWPSNRAEDLREQERLVGDLRKTDPTQADAVEKEKGCTRVRPEELAACGFYSVWPVHFFQSEPYSLFILKRISTRLGLPVWDIYPETASPG